MLPAVYFYHNARSPLQFACGRIEHAWQRGRKIAVLCEDDEQAHALDRLLWTFDPGSFIPHVLHDSALARRSPVVIGSAGVSPVWPWHDVLFNLSSGTETASPAFRLIVDIVGLGDHARLPARQRWRAYQAQGCELKALDAAREIMR